MRARILKLVVEIDEELAKQAYEKFPSRSYGRSIAHCVKASVSAGKPGDDKEAIVRFADSQGDVSIMDVMNTLGVEEGLVGPTLRACGFTPYAEDMTSRLRYRKAGAKWPSSVWCSSHGPEGLRLEGRMVVCEKCKIPIDKSA